MNENLRIEILYFLYSKGLYAKEDIMPLLKGEFPYGKDYGEQNTREWEIQKFLIGMKNDKYIDYFIQPFYTEG